MVLPDGLEVAEADIKHALRVKHAALCSPHATPPCYIRLWHTLLMFTLCPLRIFLAIFVWLAMVAVCRVCTIGFKAWDEDTQDARALPPCRKWIVHTAVRYGARCILRLFGFLWLDVRGRENIPRNAQSQQLTIVSNHISLMDCFYLASVFSPAFVVKADVRGWPFIGYIGVVLGSIFVDRDNVPRKYGLVCDL